MKSSHLVSPNVLGLLCLASVERQARDGLHSCNLGEWDRLRDLIDAQPWGTDHYAQAMNRFQNALHYYLHDEGGAAAYELKLLQGCFKF